jgi:hypothetical protein
MVSLLEMAQPGDGESIAAPAPRAASMFDRVFWDHEITVGKATAVNRGPIYFYLAVWPLRSNSDALMK